MGRSNYGKTQHLHKNYIIIRDNNLINIQWHQKKWGTQFV